MVGLLFLAAALGACGEDGGAGGPDGGAPPVGELALGGGADDGTGYVAVESGDVVPLIGGAQGGFHIWTGVRAQGVAGRIQLVREARRVSDDALVLRAPATVIEVPEDAMEDWWESPDAMASFMCPSPIGIQVFDVELRLTGQLLGEDDEVLAEDEIVVVPTCPDGDQAAFCADVCGG